MTLQRKQRALGWHEGINKKRVAGAGSQEGVTSLKVPSRTWSGSYQACIFQTEDAEGVLTALKIRDTRRPRSHDLQNRVPGAVEAGEQTS